ncbi:SOS response-associated peptidase [Pareuzebyella sediminis]|uniref:SOS response-associated peptidase n=1 Tax=Pareuzebyella sediminis TaxID=2607998 RepID=UPI0011F00602|nr:SOS response-associated peptidase family protein [Pareuzebyella sediminis]
MCYNARVTLEAQELERHYDVIRILGEMEEGEELIYNSANGFAHPNMWIIPQEKPKNMIPVKWGLIPHYKMGADAVEYYKETVRYGSGLNAKSEKLFSSNNYKNSALTRRCIVPVSGFFEPHRVEKNVKNPFSVPFYFKRRDDNPVNLAGIYAVTPDKMVTFTILTKDATPLFAKIHNKKHRRPVILQDDDVNVWLDDTLDEGDVMNVIEDDMADGSLDAWPISTDLYKRNGEGDRPDIIEKVEYEELEIDY